MSKQILKCQIFFVENTFQALSDGLFITLLPALLVTTFLNLGFPNLSATDVDTIAAGLFFAYLVGPILKAV